MSAGLIAYAFASVVTAVTSVTLYAVGFVLAVTSGLVEGVAQCARAGGGCAGRPEGIRAGQAMSADHLVLVVLSIAALGAAAFLAGAVAGRLSPRRVRPVAWALGAWLTIKALSVIVLGPQVPLWVGVLSPVGHVPSALYFPTMWYETEPVIAGARLVMLLPLVLLGGYRGSRRTRHAMAVPNARSAVPVPDTALGELPR